MAKPRHPSTPPAARAGAGRPPVQGQSSSAVLPMRISSPSRASFFSGSVRVRWDRERPLLWSSGLSFALCGLAALSRRAAADAGNAGQRKRVMKRKATAPCSWAPQHRAHGHHSLHPSPSLSTRDWGVWEDPAPAHQPGRAGHCPTRCCRHRWALQTRVSCAALAPLGPSSAAVEGSPRASGEWESVPLTLALAWRGPRSISAGYQLLQPLRVGVKVLGGLGWWELPEGIVHVGVGGRDTAQQQPTASRRGIPLVPAAQREGWGPPCPGQHLLTPQQGSCWHRPAWGSRCRDCQRLASLLPCPAGSSARLPSPRLSGSGMGPRVWAHWVSPR